jgi:hypothetical protein
VPQNLNSSQQIGENVLQNNQQDLNLPLRLSPALDYKYFSAISSIKIPFFSPLVKIRFCKVRISFTGGVMFDRCYGTAKQSVILCLVGWW